MPRWIVRQDSAVWVREYYAVDADTTEEAEEAVRSGDYAYLGHDLLDNVPHVESVMVDAVPEEESEKEPHFQPNHAA